MGVPHSAWRRNGCGESEAAVQQADAADEARAYWSFAADPQCWADIGRSSVDSPARAVVVVAIVACSCTAADDDLPKVKTSGYPFAACDVADHGVEAQSVVVGGVPNIDECVEVAWKARCSGELAFEVPVDEWGRVGDVRFGGDTSAELRQCVSAEVAKAVLLPATDCRGQGVRSAIRGTIIWGPDRGTFVRFGGVSGVIACLRTCGASDVECGPTRR